MALRLTVCALSVFGLFLNANAMAQSSLGEPAVEIDQAEYRNDALPPKAFKRLGTLTFQSNSRHIQYLAISPDQKTLVSANLGSMLNIWDLTTGQIKKQIPHRRHFNQLTFSPDGHYFAGNMSKHELVVYKASDWTKVASLQRDGDVSEFVFSPNSQQIAVAGNNGYVRILDILKNEEKKYFKAYEKSEPLPNGRGARSHILTSLTYSPDGKQLAVACMDKHIRIFNTETWEVSKKIERDIHRLLHVDFIDEGKKLIWAEGGDAMQAIGAAGSTIYTYDLKEDQTSELYQGLDSVARRLVLSPDQKLIALLDVEGKLSVVDLKTKEAIYKDKISVLKTVKTKINLPLSYVKGLDLKFSPDSKRIFATAEFTMIPRVIDLEKQEEIYPYNDHIWGIHQLVFSQDNQTLTSSDLSGLKNTWSVKEAKLSKRETDYHENYHSDDGKLYVSLKHMNDSGMLQIFEKGKKKPRANCRYIGRVKDAEFCPANTYLLLKTYEVAVGMNHVLLIDTATGEIAFKTSFFGKPIIAFSPAGQQLAIAGKLGQRDENDQIMIIDLANNYRMTMTRSTFARTSLHLTFSHDAMSLLYQSNGSKGIIQWDLVTGQKVDKFGNFNDWGYPAHVKFDHNQGQVAITNLGKIWIYNMFTGEELHRFEKTDGAITGLNFSPDGSHLATGHKPGSILIWKTGFERKVEKQVDVASLWEKATDNDIKVAYENTSLMISHAQASVAFLEKEVEKFKETDYEKIVAGIIAGLQSANYKERETAKDKLATLSPAAWGAVKKQSETVEDLEVQAAIEEWMAEAKDGVKSDKAIAQKRAVQILENIRTEEAIKLLEKWSEVKQTTALSYLADQALERIRFNEK